MAVRPGAARGENETAGALPRGPGGGLSCLARRACRQWAVRPDPRTRRSGCRSSGTKLASGFRYMRPIIRQNPDLPALPDFRNLGVVLRILVAANGGRGGGCARPGAAPRNLWASEFLDNISVAAAAAACCSLPLLYALQPWLARQPYATGAWLVAAITVACGIAVLRADRRDAASCRAGTCCARCCWACCLRRAPRLLPASREGAVAGDHRGASAGAAGAHPPAFPVQQHHRRAVARPQRSAAGRSRARGHGGPLPRADARQPRAHAARGRGRAVPPIPGAREAAPRRAAAGRMASATACPATRSCRRSCCSHCSRTPSTTASSRRARPASCRSTSSSRVATSTPILRNPYQANGGRHHAGNKMAIANVRERLALHFDAEGALESRVVGNAYEVHLRMPYRAANSAAASGAEAKRRSRQRQDQARGRRRRQARRFRRPQRKGIPWLRRRFA